MTEGQGGLREFREEIVTVIQVRHNRGWTRVIEDVKQRRAPRCVLITELIEFADRLEMPRRG